MNKEKLNSLLKLRKPVPVEDRELLLDLAGKGFLDKNVVERRIEQSIAEETAMMSQTMKSTRSKETNLSLASMTL